MTFYRHDDNGPVESKLCPEFPRKIGTERRQLPYRFSRKAASAVFN
jgi:hypothetical protein